MSNIKYEDTCHIFSHVKVRQKKCVYSRHEFLYHKTEQINTCKCSQIILVGNFDANAKMFLQKIFCLHDCFLLHDLSSSIIARAIKLFQCGISSENFRCKCKKVHQTNPFSLNPLHAIGHPIPPHHKISVDNFDQNSNTIHFSSLH